MSVETDLTLSGQTEQMLVKFQAGDIFRRIADGTLWVAISDPFRWTTGPRTWELSIQLQRVNSPDRCSQRLGRRNFGEYQPLPRLVSRARRKRCLSIETKNRRSEATPTTQTDS